MAESLFSLVAPFEPKGDQTNAIEQIVSSIGGGNKHQALMGVTGSGKTFTMAQTIQRLNRPTLVMAPNKTLAAQLFSEFKEFFPNNGVGFFISYYDYYQPEAYIPGSDTYIAKDSSINDDIDKMRHSATQALFERKDVIIVASVSCIYGLGSPAAYAAQVVNLEVGSELERNQLLRQLVDIQYTRNDTALVRGSFRVRGDVVDILPSNQNDTAIRVEFFGDELESIAIIDVLTGKTKQKLAAVSIYPNSHYITERKNLRNIVQEILSDLGVRLRQLREADKLVEYQRLEQRTMHDVELLEQLGYCPGIENYSRYLTGVAPGLPPPTLLDYFPEDFVTIIDESHLTIPQIAGMFRGDRARKQNLVDYGFRLPAALDNRPLNFEEFLGKTASILHVSATPGAFDLEACHGRIFEQVIRPTGLLDPCIEVQPATNQVDALLAEIRQTTAQGGRVLVTTLTKRMSEDLTKYYDDLQIKVRYLHSDIDSLERMELIRDLRKGVYDVLVGVNLLREGLDLPEVSLVAVMDADKEGFLRSRSALIQVVGRAARNVAGRVIFFADKYSQAMKACIDETQRRRAIQEEFNSKHGITPMGIAKDIGPGLREIYGLSDEISPNAQGRDVSKLVKDLGIKSSKELDKEIRAKTREMKAAAKDLNFELAAELRDTVAGLKELLMTLESDE